MDDKLDEIPSTTLTYTRISMPSFQPQTGPYISTQVVSRDSHQHPVSSVYINHHVCSQDHFDQQQNLTLKLAPFIHHGRLQLHFLQFWIKQPWSQHAQPWDSPFQLNQEYISHLYWFCNPEVLQGVPLHTPEPNLYFFTDASLMGWGASWQERQIMGQWSPLEQQQHINCLELEAVRLAICHWGHNGFNKQSVCIVTKAQQWPIFANSGGCILYLCSTRL